jgi:hypothetical protein
MECIDGSHRHRQLRHLGAPGSEIFESGKNMPPPVNVPVRAIVTPASGISDDAYFVAVRDQVTLVVKKGSNSFKVAVYAKLPTEQKEAMEKSLAIQIASQL